MAEHHARPGGMDINLDLPGFLSKPWLRMGFVRNPASGAWVLQEAHIPRRFPAFTEICLRAAHALASVTSLGVIVSDLLYVGLTLVVFAVLLLILKGVERFER